MEAPICCACHDLSLSSRDTSATLKAFVRACMAVSTNVGSFCCRGAFVVGVLTIRTLLFEVDVRAPDVWKLRMMPQATKPPVAPRVGSR